MSLFRKKKQPKFTENELIAIKIVSGDYLNKMEETDKPKDDTYYIVKDTLSSIKKKLEKAQV